tara:strand:+ start:8209 stop:8694 length:486 start_codon:yes stop_codon:yes gene_type:complete
MTSMRIGYGYDVHKLVEGRKLILGGVEIPHKLGLAGHSDADVLLHAITDALLGALALGDIGKHFPDTDSKYKNADSRILLRKAYQLIKKKGYELGNLDATIVAQEPKLAPYILKIRETISSDLEVNLEDISVKATTSEWLGFEGRKEGISSSAVVLLSKIG